jgi:hypothetical protein
MDSPDKGQQETVSESTEDLLSAEFDRLEAEEISAEDDLSEIEGEIEATSEENTVEVEAPEATQELKEEIQDASDSDYNEPAPERWDQSIKDTYNSLPPAGRKALLEGIYKPMQKSYTQATQQIAEQRKQLEPMIGTLQQHMNTFQRMGVDPQTVFNTQMAWAAHLQTVGAEQGLADMAAAYGVKGAVPKKAGQEEYLTPTERAFKEQIDALQAQVAGQQNQYQQATQQQQEQAIEAHKQEITRSLQTFINEKSDDGKPAHPHVEKVASNISGILRGGLVRKVDDYGNPVAIYDQLKQAYSMACNLDPSIRTPVSDTRQARVKAAQKVGVVTKSPASHVSPDDAVPMEQFIEKTWEALDRKAS